MDTSHLDQDRCSALVEDDRTIRIRFHGIYRTRLAVIESRTEHVAMASEWMQTLQNYASSRIC
jgi:hypothetical protein